MENSIIDKERTIGTQQSEIKVLQRLLREYEKNNDKYFTSENGDIKNKLKSILDENKFLKEKLKLRRPLLDQISEPNKVESTNNPSAALKNRLSELGRKENTSVDDKLNLSNNQQDGEHKFVLPSFKRKFIPPSPLGKTSTKLNKSFHITQRQNNSGGGEGNLINDDKTVGENNLHF